MRRRQESLRRTLRVEGCTVRMSTVRASILPHPATGTIKTMHSDHRSGDSEVGYQAIPDHNGADVDVRSIPVNFNGRPGLASPRGRSKSLNVKLGSNVLVPEVGTASDVVLASDGLARDDMYMEGISLRRNFASEFVAMLEVTKKCQFSLTRVELSLFDLRPWLCLSVSVRYGRGGWCG